MKSSHPKQLFRLGGAALAILGATLLTAYFARWWPYAHREDFQFNVLSSSGRDFVASEFIPLPLVPCLLLGVGVGFWIVSMLGSRKVRHE
jgi:hypothetical protein